MSFSNFLTTFDELSFKKIVSIMMLLAIIFALPVGVYLVRQRTRLESKAAYVKPERVKTPKATPGPVPEQPPEIGRIFPWVGKVGDIIWVQGKNFGTNPTDKKLTIGDVVVQDVNIEAWEDTLIQAYIPEGAEQGGIVEVKVGWHPVSQSLPYVLYDKTTEAKLRKNGEEIRVENLKKADKAVIWTGDDIIPIQKHVKKISLDSNGFGRIFDTQGLPILSIVLTTTNGEVIPYYVDPVEFDF